MLTHIPDRIFNSNFLTIRVCKTKKKFRRLFTELFTRRYFFGCAAFRRKVPRSRYREVGAGRERDYHIPFSAYFVRLSVHCYKRTIAVDERKNVRLYMSFGVISRTRKKVTAKRFVTQFP